MLTSSKVNAANAELSLFDLRLAPERIQRGTGNEGKTKDKAKWKSERVTMPSLRRSTFIFFFNFFRRTVLVIRWTSYDRYEFEVHRFMLSSPK